VLSIRAKIGMTIKGGFCCRFRVDVEISRRRAAARSA